MNRVRDIFRGIVVSPEFVFVAASILVTFAKPEFLIPLASRVNATEELLKYLALVPPAAVVLLIRSKDDLLFPDKHQEYDLLQSWPQYHMVSDRYGICLMWGILGSLVTFSVWIFGGDLSNYATFSAFFCSIITSLIAALTFFGATVSVRRILSTAGKKRL